MEGGTGESFARKEVCRIMRGRTVNMGVKEGAPNNNMCK